MRRRKEGTDRMSQPEIDRLLQRIERNCEAITRIMDDPDFTGKAKSRAISRRITAFAQRDAQLVEFAGAALAHDLSFRILKGAIRHWRKPECTTGERIYDVYDECK